MICVLCEWLLADSIVSLLAISCTCLDVHAIKELNFDTSRKYFGKTTGCIFREQLYYIFFCIYSNVRIFSLLSQKKDFQVGVLYWEI